MGSFVCLVWLLASHAGAQPPSDPFLTNERMRFLLEVQRLLFDDQFHAADALISRYRSTDTNDPTGLLFAAGSLMTQMTDREEEITPDYFKSLVDSCLEITEPMLEGATPREQAWLYLIRGHAHAYRSLYSSRFGSFTAAIDHGFDAKGEYERGLKADSTLYDLYFGLGSFHYWKSAKAGILRWIGLFRNDKAKGIRELQLAADSSLVSREAARNALIWVYFDNDKFEQAQELVDSALAHYPNGRTFLWPLAQAQYERKEYLAAITTYGELRRRLERQPGNYYNLIECDYYLTKCHAELDQEEQAKLAAMKLADYYADLTKSVRERQNGNLSYLKKVAKRNRS